VTEVAGTPGTRPIAGASPAPSRSRALTARWLSRWEPAIADAVSALPDLGGCPRELYLTMLEINHRVAGGRTAIVERGGRPIAVIALQRTGMLRWRNVTNAVLPGFVTAAAADDLLPALRALNVEVDASWWHLTPPDSSDGIREHHVVPQYRITVAEREAYWRRGSMWGNLRRARKKCDGLELDIDRPGDAAWVIRSCAQKWADGWNATEEAAMQSTLEVARHFEPLGRHVTLTLRSGGEPITGITALVSDDGVVVGGKMFRDVEKTGKLPTGDRLLDALCDHADERGWSAVDFGGGYAYKAHWAPEHGARHDLLIGPAWTHAARTLARKALRKG
jgi:hypothetical protein